MSDIEIARKANKKPIQEIGAKLGIGPEHLLPFGHDKAKVSELGHMPGQLPMLRCQPPVGPGRLQRIQVLLAQLNRLGHTRQALHW